LKKIKALIFDLGNVLVDFNHHPAAERVSRFSKKSSQEIYNFFFESALTISFEKGEISPDEFFLKVKESLSLKLSYDSFVHIWNDIFFLSPKNRMVYSLVNNLHCGYKTALLSNINILHYEYLKKSFPVFNVFSQIMPSFELGAVKPEPIIYKKALERLAVDPEEAFYTDDRVDLIASAKKLGIKSFVFKTVEQLKKDLYKSGVAVQ